MYGYYYYFMYRLLNNGNEYFMHTLLLGLYFLCFILFGFISEFPAVKLNNRKFNVFFELKAFEMCLFLCSIGFFFILTNMLIGP